MNVLLVYPKFPDTFWSFKHALRFVGKKATLPPLGLLTVAGMLPQTWTLRLVDLNTQPLRARDLRWADMAFISGMTIQKSSAQELIARCRAAKLITVAGGPLFTMEPELFSEVDHLVLNEAEITLPLFLADLADGHPKPRYESKAFPHLATTPTPRWDLVRQKDYHAMPIQFSRGCPFNCDFCNITSLLGRKVRIKSTPRILTELDALYAAGWHGRIFFVDDNFIGNKEHVKSDLLPALVQWRQGKNGISLQTEASINLADDPELMDLLTQAGFDTVFVGIETPNANALQECNKKQNEQRDLVADVKKMQRAGLQVQGGFIVGFDSDTPSIFQKQIAFIQQSGIVTAMVGLLQAPIGTRLHERMEKEGRIQGVSTGDNVEGSTNIRPLMDPQRLHDGYREIMNTLYTPRYYYQRIRTLLQEYRAPQFRFSPTRYDIMALLRSMLRLGILSRERLHYWRLLAWTTRRRPDLFPMAVTLAISGYHFRKVCKQHVH